MSETADHRVDLVTRNGDRASMVVSAKEAARLENEPLRPESNISEAHVRPL